MSVLYMSALVSSYKRLKFGILSFTTVFLCGVYCTYESSKMHVDVMTYPCVFLAAPCPIQSSRLDTRV